MPMYVDQTNLTYLNHLFKVGRVLCNTLFLRLVVCFLFLFFSLCCVCWYGPLNSDWLFVYPVAFRGCLVGVHLFPEHYAHIHWDQSNLLLNNVLLYFAHVFGYIVGITCAIML